uniref:Uncharacterized protein n=1 Tax=viral metagenome TaxID=1070528 RepID=A0A6C0LIU5_9ZZZZ
MSTQIFKQKVPTDAFFNVLSNICTITQSAYFKLDKCAFKKGVLSDDISTFIEYLKDYYHTSKLHYLENKVTYNSFKTIARQICKANSITFASKLIYGMSTYEIVYYIYK